MARVFLLSPANTAGLRAQMLLREEASFDLAVRVRSGGAPLGEVFTFMSQLYFRGKAAYVRRFAAPPKGAEGALVITAGSGLVPIDRRVTTATLQAFEEVPIDI